ncbi:MAG: serine/threonine protein kinase, partial [Polyangiaceae bacterium]|nr:serine/threonine protein kinase [Polyangiaceae bacterium]
MTHSEDLFGQLSVGTVIKGRYLVGEAIGKGGNGVIYKSTDMKTGGLVAVKTLNADVNDRPSAVARYAREARAASSIGHPNICTVSDVGLMGDGRPFLVMELLCGETLAVCIRDKGAMPFPAIINVLTQTLSALEAAHAHLIVHRDIKPDNVYLTSRVPGVVSVKLLDFGIAKSMDQATDLALTRQGMVVGTPLYMAPEQARGEQLDHRVDIYACGLLLFEMLTARRPFQAKNFSALMAQVLAVAPPDPRDFRPATPSGLAKIVAKALAKDRRDRFSDARAFLTALWAQQSVIAAGPGPEEIERIARAVRHPKSSDKPLSHRSSSGSIPVLRSSVPPRPIGIATPQNRCFDDKYSEDSDSRPIQ